MTDSPVGIEILPPCVGSGMCVGIAPELFHLANGRAVAAAGMHELKEDLVSAWESCPASAIRLVSAEGEDVEPEW